MTLLDLYNYADNSNIQIFSRKHDKKPAFVVKLNTDYFLSMDYSLIKTEQQEREILAEEIGHCESDAFYFLSDYNNPVHRQNIERAERKAHDWATKALIPFDSLLSAIAKTKDEHEICEILDVSIEALYYAVDYYKRKCLM